MNLFPNLKITLWSNHPKFIEASPQDLDSLGVVVVRYRGYTAVAEASGLDTLKIEGLPADLEIEDQPDGGADALNVNR